MKQNEDATMFKHSKVEPLFNMVKDQKTNKVIICVGNYKVSSKEFKSYKDAEIYISSRPYELIINTSVLFFKFEQDENNKTSAKDTKDNL